VLPFVGTLVPMLAPSGKSANLCQSSQLQVCLPAAELNHQDRHDTCLLRVNQTVFRVSCNVQDTHPPSPAAPMPLDMLFYQLAKVHSLQHSLFLGRGQSRTGSYLTAIAS